ncbi:MAG: type II toxin-antitoxin system VapC family toxin [Planctomycetia bacterium]|nr:type II toxin-antitoxin system VapC family toxin [Planctomycetia bacterium]
MACLYFDSSALVKRYVLETGTAWISSLVAPAAGHECVIATITGVELLAAFYLRTRVGSITVLQAQQAEAAFRGEQLTRFRRISATSPILDLAMQLVARHPLRAYDAIQLATALFVHTQRLAANLGTVTFVSADQKLNQAASAEQLPVDDPNQHP